MEHKKLRNMLISLIATYILSRYSSSISVGFVNADSVDDNIISELLKGFVVDEVDVFNIFCNYLNTLSDEQLCAISERVTSKTEVIVE